MSNILLNNTTYEFKESFDVNLTLDYENDRWTTWHIVREFISNALDSVNGDPNNVSITEEAGYFNIGDTGPGYPLIYAKRIGASSKKSDVNSIGQFGEGSKMAVLTCLRNRLSVRLVSKNWLIEPRLITVEEAIQVLVFDIYESSQSIQGSLVSIQATDEVREFILNRDRYFLHFSSMPALFGYMNAGIFPRTDKSSVFNKGVYIKDIEALFAYALSIGELNRDRDVVDDDLLCRAIRDVWNKVDNSSLIQAYFMESERAGKAGAQSDCKEFEYCIYPQSEVSDIWIKTFHEMFGTKAVIYTNDLAANEALYLGYVPVRLEYYGRNLAEHLGIQKDVDVCRDDYEFTWADNLTKAEQDRLYFFRQVADIVGMKCPETIRVFEAYAKSEYVVGQYNRTKDEIYIKRERLSGDLVPALETFIHELTHKETKADDGDRSFANGLSTLAAKVVLELTSKIGLPVTLPLSDRGFQLPRTFSYSANNLLSGIATVGSEIVIKTCGHTLRAMIPGINLRPYSTERDVTFYKGHFYLNVPAAIRETMPSQVSFSFTMGPEQI